MKGEREGTDATDSDLNFGTWPVARYRMTTSITGRRVTTTDRIKHETPIKHVHPLVVQRVVCEQNQGYDQLPIDWLAQETI